MGPDKSWSPEKKRMAVVAGVAGGAILVSLVVLAGFAWYRIRQDLSQAPPRTAIELAPNVPTSVLSFPVTLPFNGLVARIETAAPHTFTGSGNGPDACFGQARKVCSGTRYDYTATRGPISAGPGPDGSLRITVPLTVNGHVALRGDGAKLLHIQPKGFDVSAEALADLTLDMSQDWCPRLHVSTGFNNLSALVQVTKGAAVDVAQYIKDSVQKGLATLGAKAAGTVNCADVRNILQDVWVTRSFPLPLPGDPRPLHVNVDPVSFGFSGVKLSQTDASFLLSLGVQVSVGDAALPAQAKPLPAWTPVTAGRGGVTLAIPLRITYDSLDAHLLALLGSHPLHLNTIRGPGTIAVDELNIYPSGDRIAVGAHLNAKMPDSFFDTQGWVYWTARPTLSADGKGVRLAEIGYSKLSGNPVVRMLTNLVDKEMQKGLASAGQLDLTQSLAKTAEQVKSGLGGGKLAFDLSNASIKVGRIVAGQDALFIEAVFSAGATDSPAGGGA
jgi:hypothetical protein